MNKWIVNDSMVADIIVLAVTSHHQGPTRRRCFSHSTNESREIDALSGGKSDHGYATDAQY
jgi:hypothetical protein